jgi:hypothetical protein
MNQVERKALTFDDGAEMSRFRRRFVGKRKNSRWRQSKKAEVGVSGLASGISGQPALHRFGLVGNLGIEDRMQVELGWHLLVD